jgi:ABC-2 type transport system ATP-binding protein
MRQRLGLGISILSEPRLLILDEPTGGLDQEGLSVLWSVLAEWREKGRLVLMASHELTLMERRVDLMCVLRDGRVLAEDSPVELRKATALPVAVVFSTQDAGDDGRALLAAIQDWGRMGNLEHGEGQLRVEVEPEDLLAVLELGTKSGGVESVRVIEPGLDDVYEKLLESEP